MGKYFSKCSPNPLRRPRAPPSSCPRYCERRVGIFISFWRRKKKYVSPDTQHICTHEKTNALSSRIWKESRIHGAVSSALSGLKLMFMVYSHTHTHTHTRTTKRKWINICGDSVVRHCGVQHGIVGYLQKSRKNKSFWTRLARIRWCAPKKPKSFIHFFLYYYCYYFHFSCPLIESARLSRTKKKKNPETENVLIRFWLLFINFSISFIFGLLLLHIRLYRVDGVHVKCCSSWYRAHTHTVEHHLRLLFVHAPRVCLRCSGAPRNRTFRCVRAKYEWRRTKKKKLKQVFLSLPIWPCALPTSSSSSSRARRLWIVIANDGCRRRCHVHDNNKGKKNWWVYNKQRKLWRIAFGAKRIHKEKLLDTRCSTLNIILSFCTSDAPTLQLWVCERNETSANFQFKWMHLHHDVHEERRRQRLAFLSIHIVSILFFCSCVVGSGVGICSGSASPSGAGSARRGEGVSIECIALIYSWSWSGLRDSETWAPAYRECSQKTVHSAWLTHSRSRTHDMRLSLWRRNIVRSLSVRAEKDARHEDTS